MYILYASMRLVNTGGQGIFFIAFHFLETIKIAQI